MSYTEICHLTDIHVRHMHVHVLYKIYYDNFYYYDFYNDYFNESAAIVASFWLVSEQFAPVYHCNPYLLIALFWFVLFLQDFYNEFSELRSGYTFPDNSEDTEPGVYETRKCNRIYTGRKEGGLINTETHVTRSKLGWFPAGCKHVKRILIASSSPTETSVMVREVRWGHDVCRDSQSDQESPRETEHGKIAIGSLVIRIQKQNFR